MDKVSHPSVADRKAQGKGAREQASLSSHTGWTPAVDRADPVALLEEQDVTREPDLVPVRHGRMMVSPFTFYRGAAKIMAADLKDTPTAGLNVQLCGDAHLSNFGVFASPERTLLFDVNDFDETLPGPFEYDVKRMAASFAIAARNNAFAKSDVSCRDDGVGAGLSGGNDRVRGGRHDGHLVRAHLGRRGAAGHEPGRTGAERIGTETVGEEGPEDRRESAHQRQPASTCRSSPNTSTVSTGSSANPPWSSRSVTYPERLACRATRSNT